MVLSVVSNSVLDFVAIRKVYAITGGEQSAADCAFAMTITGLMAASGGCLCASTTVLLEGALGDFFRALSGDDDLFHDTDIKVYSNFRCKGTKNIWNRQIIFAISRKKSDIFLVRHNYKINILIIFNSIKYNSI